MKKIDKKKIALFLIILGIILCIYGVFNNKKKDNITKIEEALEHVFFYLPESSYDNLNEMSDYCKISLIYGTDYLKKDALLSKDNYDTIVKKNGIKGYKISNVLKSIKSILGEDATINFSANEDGDYEFLFEDKCKYGNKSLKTLSYNESLEYIYSIDDDQYVNNSKLFVKWDKPVIDGDIVVLTAQALLGIKNSDGGYDIFIDSNLNQIDSISGNINYNILKLYDKSYIYKFTLKKVNDNYNWIKYEVVNNLEDDVIYDKY